MLALILLSPPLSAQNCGALGKEVRVIQSDAFDEYPLLNDVKQGILLMLYGRGSTDCPQELYDFAAQGKEFITLFDEAYNLSRSNSSEDRLLALNHSYVLEDIAASMLGEKDLGASALDIATSARNVLTDFLITQGEVNERDGKLANRTRDKIAYYRQATLAYEAADENILAANTRLNWNALEKEYTKDMEIAGEMSSEAESKLEEAKSISGAAPSKMRAYVNAMEALELYEGALLYYVKHQESEKIQETHGKITEVREVMDSLRSALLLYFLVLTLSLVAVALFLLNRLLAWNADTYEYYLGNELIKVRGVEY